MPQIQDLLHKLEVGGGQRYVKGALSLFLLILIFFGYNIRSFRNLNTQEAMDSAQLARNIADGEGYTTKFIRPLSIYLHQKQAFKDAQGGDTSQITDAGHLKGPHPDISNAPVYPVVLAGLMKVLPFTYDNLTPGPFWYRNGRFWRAQPDFLISVFNQFLMLAMLVATWFLTRRLFDAEVAWISALCLLGIELLWRFSVSGLSTLLLMLMMSGILWLLYVIEAEAREPRRRFGNVLIIAAVLGLLVGLGGLTRYSFLWIILPVTAYLLIYGGVRRLALTGTVLAAFLLVMTPWIARNIHQSGLPFGTATYAPVEESGSFPGDRLQRSLEADVGVSDFFQARYKLVSNLRSMAQKDLFEFGGTWVIWFFVAGLMIGFRNPATQRLRFFVLMGFVTLFIVQAIGRTKLSTDSPEINSENLLVLFVPVMVSYGVAFFTMLLDNIRWKDPVFRSVAIGGFIFLSAVPLLLTLTPPRPLAIAYPPYYPPHIQRISELMKPDELIMSDVPWAVAWYGNRQSIWITLDVDNDFYAINDFQRPIKGLFLTPITMDAKFVSTFLRSGNFSWGNFVFHSISKGELPHDFPLRSATQTLVFWPEELFLTDWPRWKAQSSTE